MRKVDLRMNEQFKYDIIKKLVDTNGNKKKVAIKLNCTERHINRLIHKYKTEGKEGFVHGNRGKLPSTTIPLEIKNKIIALYTDQFSDANLTHFCEIIKEDFGISISDTTLNHWLREIGVISPKARRKTKNLLKAQLNQKLKKTKSVKLQNAIKESIAVIDDSSAHARRPRCKYFGEMIQMDASSFQWIPGQTWHLHAAIDDATNTVVGLYFDTQETLNGYYHVLYQILTNFGIPALFYTDKRTVFEYQKKNAKDLDKDTYTQFSYACHNLGIDIKTTSIAQAKGRIERLNETLQSRLPIELRRAHITDIESANEFLKSYLKKFNEQFALPLNITKSVFEKQPSLQEINTLLSVLSPRTIDSGHSIKYKNKIYIPTHENGTPIYFKNKTTCMVIEAFDKNLYVNVLDVIYHLKEVPSHQKYSLNFDPEHKESKPKKKYIPPMSHPWKHASFLNYLEKQKHLSSGANV